MFVPFHVRNVQTFSVIQYTEFSKMMLMCRFVGNWYYWRSSSAGQSSKWSCLFFPLVCCRTCPMEAMKDQFANEESVGMPPKFGKIHSFFSCWARQVHCRANILYAHIHLELKNIVNCCSVFPVFSLCKYMCVGSWCLVHDLKFRQMNNFYLHNKRYQQLSVY